MYNFIKVFQTNFNYAKTVFTIEEVREIFQFVRLNNYELFKMFYEWDEVKYRGGKIVNEWD